MKFDEENLGAALDIFYSILKNGSITRSDNPREFLWYDQETEVREALEICARKQGLILCRYHDAFYLSPGINNPIFGLSNTEIKNSLGYGFKNPEMYTAFFIMHVLIAEFYRDSSREPYLEKVHKNRLLEVIEKKIKAMEALEDLEMTSEGHQFNFKVIAETWNRLPSAEFRPDESDEIKQRGISSKNALVNSTIAFMEKNQIVREHDGAVYLTPRCKAIIAWTYSNEEIQADLRAFIEGLGESGGEGDA
ncbi:MAG: hypothetical protein D5R96_05945 [Methanocalculus sp. MSAO_Arc2]|uniref:DUF6063 family protein n=1 Tax=Methanocalculus sp. MSAO_Arc2 TaxID=2293855 RepID=UPI000FF3588C|nr:MAG: hypothetical protein D5R96_05945 [Methanocalculus sp. MSAO_Arc2]